MDTAFFSAHLVRGLTDKIYDKRKSAALLIEKLVRENEKAPAHITEIIDTLVQDFVYSNNSNARNGGLIGLAATAIALGPAVAPYLDIIVPPILSCFSNNDSRVRYYACESMYNIAKVAKGEVLRFFNSIFDALCKLAADPALTVKNGADLLDRLIKDIVSELSTTYVSAHDQPLNPAEQQDSTDPPLVVPNSLPRNTAFSLPRFIPVLRQRIYVRNSFTRQYLVSWISVLDSIPDLELVSFLPEFLDGLLNCLSDPSDDVRVATSELLKEFLNEIQEAAAARDQQEKPPTQQQPRKRSTDESAPPPPLSSSPASAPGSDAATAVAASGPEETQETEESKDEATLGPDNDEHGKGTYVPGQGVIVQYERIIDILVRHLSSKEEHIQRTALEWINVFIVIAPHVVIQFTPKIILAVLPCLAHPVDVIRDTAKKTNKSLQHLVLATPTPAPPLPQPSPSVSDPSAAPSLGAQMSDAADAYPPALRRVYHSDVGRPSSTAPRSEDPFDYQITVSNLRLQFLNEHEETRVAGLEWLLMLHKKAPNKILASDDGTFPALLKTLSDSSEEVVRRDLQLLAQISSYSDHEYFRSFMMNLLSLFSTDRRLLETRGSLIIRQLCLSLDPERIYCTIADILEHDEDLEFASIMVQNLNIILITSSELGDLRKRLRNLDHRDGQRLFNVLYRSWCHNSVAAFSLCLLAQAYEHAANMLQVFAEMEITVNMLIQVDKLVQLLESPVFTYLRMQLLEPEKHPNLFKCLYGILMLLPQSSAFSTLRNRLSAVSSLGFFHVMPAKSAADTNPTKQRSSKTAATSTKQTEETPPIKFQDLLQHFKNVQARHERQRKQALQNIPRSPPPKSRRSRYNSDPTFHHLREELASTTSNANNKMKGSALTASNGNSMPMLGNSSGTNGTGSHGSGGNSGAVDNRNLSGAAGNHHHLMRSAAAASRMMPRKPSTSSPGRK